MLRRFAAGSAVMSVLVTLAAAGALLLLRLYSILFIWCVLPCIWGVWAMLCPSAWVPKRFPIWGAILGFIAALIALFVLNLPARVLGLTLSTLTRALLVLGATVVYYGLWTIVGIEYTKLAGARS